MKENTKPVVYLGGNHYTALGGIRTLGRRGVPVYALDYNFSTAYALSSRYVKEKVLCPWIGDSEKNFADFLLKLSEHFQEPPVLMASHDAYAIVMSNYTDVLSKKYLFHRGEQGLFANLINKKGLYGFSLKYGLPMPLTFFLASQEEEEKAIKEMAYPCIVKPVISHEFTKVFRKKCFIINNAVELKDALKKTRKAKIEVMVQEIVPGFDDQMFLLDVFINKKGEATHSLTMQKLRQYPINFGVTSFGRQLYVPEIIEPGIDFLQKVGYQGFCEIEFKRHSESGKYLMVDFNARLTNFTSLLDACGMEAAYLIYRDLINKPLPPRHLRENMNRAFYHFFEDSVASYAYLHSGQLKLWQIIKPLLKYKKVHAVWAIDDVKPFFNFYWMKIKRQFKKLKRHSKRGGNEGF